MDASSRPSEADATAGLVQQGYDAIAPTYLAWTTAQGSPRPAKIEQLLARLQPTPADRSVLELGCGAGVPGTQMLVAACGRVVASDISAAQLELAREYVKPTAAGSVEFVQADMQQLVLPATSFDAVVALYCLLHLPREELPAMLRRIAGWLRSGGWLLCNLGVDDQPGSTEEWLGTRMFFSSYDAATNRRLLEEAGFEVVVEEVIVDKEDGRPVPFQWVLAQTTQA